MTMAAVKLKSSVVTDAGLTNQSYAGWLREHGVRLFNGLGSEWELQKGALLPVATGPYFIQGSNLGEANSLLKESGAWFLRFASDPCEEETEWWYTVCDRYDQRALSSKVRNQIKRGARECSVERIDAEWLAKNGYHCYSAAYGRYKNARPSGIETFQRNLMRTVGGPFEYWGIFVGNNLAGYCQCIVEQRNVATNVIKFNPGYLKHYVSYALTTSLIEHYVSIQGKVLSNGTRSVAHDTNIQDLLLKLGFRKQFCRLNAVYQPSLGIAARAAFPFRKVIAALPDCGVSHKLRAFLFQEELRRRCR